MVRLKGGFGEYRNRANSRFQFLMVRLKVSDEAYSEKITGISIPYGAIKRSYSFYRAGAWFGFQFLMVRLKATRNNDEHSRIQNFNSLWCD